MKIKILKIFLVLLPYFLLSIIIYFIFYRFVIYDKNNNPIYGIEFNKEELEIDKSHIFYFGKNKKIVSVLKNKIISQKELINKSFFVSPAYNDKLIFQVNLKDSLIIDSYSYSTNEKIIAVSDIEGNFKVFIEFLITNNVIDKKLNWIFGKGHLVCNGDFFDRGEDVTATLWLIYKLEQEAEKNGGKVHFIIGNHEEMNLRGNVKYVKPKYQTLAVMLNIPYKEIYGKDTELGRWLRTKNIMININNILFTHGGISPLFIKNKYTIKEANNLVRLYLSEDSDYLKFINERAFFLYDKQGPMWYRGFVEYKDSNISQNDVDIIVKNIGVSKIVVGHTIVEKVKPLFKNKIIAIDVMEENDPRIKDDDLASNSCQGLLINTNKFYRIFSSKEKELMFEDK